jgi:hypothetical protein
VLTGVRVVGTGLVVGISGLTMVGNGLMMVGTGIKSVFLRAFFVVCCSRPCCSRSSCSRFFPAEHFFLLKGLPVLKCAF